MRGSGWASLAGRGPDSWRRVGKLQVGAVLGLGPKGNLGTDCVALLHPDLARPTRRLVDGIRPRRGERGLFSRRAYGVVWRELCFLEMVAQLRVWHPRRDLRSDFFVFCFVFCAVFPF